MSDLLSFNPSRAADGNLRVVPGAQAFFYNSGTTTLRTVYADAAQTIPHPVPLVADAAGIFPQVFVGGAPVKVVVRTATGGTLYTMDPCVKVPASASAAGNVSFTPSANVQETNVQAAIDSLGARLYSGYGLANVVYIVGGTGTYNRPANVRALFVSVVGAGGGGGGVDGQGTGTAAAGGPGGGGGTATRFIRMPATSYAYSVGTGGAGGLGSNGGLDGNDSTFSGGGTTLEARGGRGGEGATATNNALDSAFGGLGGIALGGLRNIPGSDGGYSLCGNGNVRISGTSGASMFGGGVRSSRANGDGRDGDAPGAGGSGATVADVATNFSGGRGANGIIIIEEYV